MLGAIVGDIVGSIYEFNNHRSKEFPLFGMNEARRTAEVTHNHPEGVKGAQATAIAIFMARKGQSKEDIKTAIAQSFGYDLNRTVDEIRPTYVFNESCQETVPEAIIAFLESKDFEDAIRNAISLGGDSDTLACITGGIAEAFYGGVPTDIAKKALSYLDFNMREIVEKFYGSLSQSEAS
ncbi:MAG: ADP-ribosylglycohydrolase family protein [Pseudanabaena sp.]|jgi:ADP-ribosylglycohydrolase